MTKHLVKENAIIDGTALLSDEILSPSMERLIVMEWLHRMDNRLIKFVQEKFSTELSAGSSVLITMIETLSRNIDSYITIINSSNILGPFYYLTGCFDEGYHAHAQVFDQLLSPKGIIEQFVLSIGLQVMNVGGYDAKSL